MRATRGRDGARGVGGGGVRLTGATQARGDGGDGGGRRFKTDLKLESFYTGGTIVASADETLLAATCGEDIKIVETATGSVRHTLPGVRRQRPPPAPRQAPHHR